MSSPTIARELHDHWHKLVGALLARYGDQRLGEADLAAIDGMAVVASHDDDGRTLVLRLMPQAEAERLEREFCRGDAGRPA